MDNSALQKQELKIGATVKYIPGHAKGDTNHPDCEVGKVTEIRHSGVFVRFRRESAECCTPGDLILYNPESETKETFRQTNIPFEDVKEFFQKCADNFDKLETPYCALLWREGLRHLEEMRLERDMSVLALGAMPTYPKNRNTLKNLLCGAIRRIINMIRHT